MPYFITDQSPDCPDWATVKEDGEVMACHATKDDAVAQMVALSLDEDMEPGGELRITGEIPGYVKDAASKGLEYFADGQAGDGVTDGTVREARLMASGSITDDKVIRANAWAARHAVDLEASQNNDANDDAFPGPGAVAHYLWGIDPLNPEPARAWFARQAAIIHHGNNDSSASAIKWAEECHMVDFPS